MTARDRAAELAAAPDLWPEIRLRLWEAADDAADAARHFAYDFDDYQHHTMRNALEAKFRAGEAEHGRDWLTMTREQLQEEIRNELRDLVLYHAMILTRWVDDAPSAASPFLTNRDPGDEQDSTD